MENNLVEKGMRAYQFGKYTKKLGRCCAYLRIIKNGDMTAELFEEAEKFSVETYIKLFRENARVTETHTCLVARNIPPLENLKYNLEALEQMLLDLIEQERKKIGKEDEGCARGMDGLGNF